MCRPDPPTRLLDAVRLTRRAGAWPAGTVGTVVSMHSDVAMVEIVETEHEGSGLPVRDLLEDLVGVPLDALEVLRPR